MLKRFVTSKRVAIGAYLSLGAFLLAHTVNAFVADALRPPPIQISALDSIVSFGVSSRITSRTRGCDCDERAVPSSSWRG